MPHPLRLLPALALFAAPLGGMELGGLDHQDIEKHADHDLIVKGDIHASDVKLSSEEDIIIRGEIDGGHVELKAHGKVIIEGAIGHGAQVTIMAHGFASTGTVRGHRVEESHGLLRVHHEEEPTRLTVRECDTLKIKGNIEDGAHVDAHAWDKVVVDGDVVHDAHLKWWADRLEITGHRGESADIRQENWGDFHHR